MESSYLGMAREAMTLFVEVQAKAAELAILEAQLAAEVATQAGPSGTPPATSTPTTEKREERKKPVNNKVPSATASKVVRRKKPEGVPAEARPKSPEAAYATRSERARFEVGSHSQGNNRGPSRSHNC
jgi:hypothetical protein